jgi:catechol 2,3-dioxygenase-like lactoylglutathione lyase family enzyme
MQKHKVSGFYHYGIAVNDLEKITDFFVEHLGLSLIANREIRAPYIQNLVGASDVWAEVNMLELDSSSYLEILRWHEGSKSEESIQGTITSTGAQHLCLYVPDLESLFQVIKQLPIVKIISSGVTIVSEGPNVGAKVAFILVDQSLYIELFQKPDVRN